MASLRRSKTLTPDGQTARFLYTIIKQLDLKTIDWNEVASGLDITNGHAARMRFSRFKQQIEGIPTQPRAPRTKKDSGSETGKKAKGKKGLKRSLDDTAERVKGEAVKEEDVDAPGEVDTEPRLVVKDEERVQVKLEQQPRDERNEHGEPAIVKIKREPCADDLLLQIQPASVELVQPDPLTTPMTVATAPAAPRASPPLATVSLADLHLSPKLQSSPMLFSPPLPSYTFVGGLHAASEYSHAYVPRVKVEPEIEQIPAMATSTYVKTESIQP